MLDSKLAAVCGLHCGACEHLGSRCKGCGHVQGKPFWTVIMKVNACPLYDCCINTRQLEHCGLCNEFPCATFLEMQDPALSEAEAEKALQERQQELIRRREIGTQDWLAKKKTP